MPERKIRVLSAKPGLDGHDRDTIARAGLPFRTRSLASKPGSTGELAKDPA